MKKLVQVTPGELYAIPLFLCETPVTTSLSRRRFDDEGLEFAFCRVIEDHAGAGILVEVFDVVGNLQTSLDSILGANRLFRPVATSGLAIHKKRWRKVGEQPDYDGERHSRYSEIQLVIGPPDQPRLWQNGVETPITVDEAQEYESWTIWAADRLERRIVQSLADR